MALMWFKIDDHFHEHRKVRKLGRERVAAVGVWTLCGTWAAQNMTDGFVPEEVVDRYDPDGTLRHLLVDVELWQWHSLDGEDGISYVDWAEFQPLKAEIVAVREKRVEAGRRGGQAKQANAKQSASRLLDAGQNGAVANAKQSARDVLKQISTPTRPVPEPKEENTLSGDAGRDAPKRFTKATLDAEFAQWWAVYPVKEAKLKSRENFEKARRSGAELSTLIDAVERYVPFCRSIDRKFKHPATWLHQGCWMDELDERKPLPDNWPEGWGAVGGDDGLDMFN